MNLEVLVVRFLEEVAKHLLCVEEGVDIVENENHWLVVEMVEMMYLVVSRCPIEVRVQVSNSQVWW